MLVIGLTGGIGSGKSTALREFKRLGAHVIDADVLARRAVDPGKPAWRAIRERFRKKVFHKNHRLNRKKLASIVFKDKKALKELNAIIHPQVKTMEDEIINAIRKKERRAVVVVDAPMMIEAGFHKTRDVLVVMNTTRENQVRRLVKSGRHTRAQALARINNQMPLSEKLRYADYVIDNNATPGECRKNVREVFRRILKDRKHR